MKFVPKGKLAEGATGEAPSGASPVQLPDAPSSSVPNSLQDAPGSILDAPPVVEYPPNPQATQDAHLPEEMHTGKTQAIRELGYIGEWYGNRYIPNFQFLQENEWKEQAFIQIDWEAETDEWVFAFKRHETFSVYAEFQYSIGGRLGAKWDRELHGWKFPATTYNIKDLLDYFDRERKNAEKFNWSDTSHYGIILKYFKAIEFTPIAKAMIEAKRNMEERWEKLQSVAEAIQQFIDEGETPLMKHQQNGIEFMLSHDAVLADDMGTGKTRQMLNVMWHLFQQKEIRRAIVICPVTAKGVWRTQSRQYFGKKMIPIIAEGTFEERLNLLASIFPPTGEMPLYIISYGTATAHPVELQNLCDDGMLVLDEAHRIKSMNAKRTQLIHSLRARFVKPLTGTPIVNTPIDAFSLFQLVKPGLLGRNYEQFFNHFAYRDGRYGIKYRNLEEFNKRIQPYYIRRLKKDVLELPEKMFLRDYEEIEMGEKQRQLYNDMRTKAIIEIEGISEENYVVFASNIMAKLLRLLQICDGYVSGGVERGVEWISDAGKVKSINEILEDYATNGRKVVVWSRFIPPLEMLSVELNKYNPVVLHGGIPSQKRGVGPRDDINTTVGKFWHDDKCKVFLGQIHTGGEGIDLSIADTCIFYDQWWSPGINMQAEDRLHRIGQKNKVTIIPLVMARSIEEYYFAEEYEYNGETLKGLLSQKKDDIGIAIEGVNTVIPSKKQLLEWLRRV